MSGITRILVVDDDETVREALQLKLKDYLSYLGAAQVHGAGNGEEALQLLEQQKYHFILMDTQMPGPLGYEVCSQMKKMYPDLTVFGMSMDHNYRQQWMDAGANGFIPKFQLRNSLEKVVKDYLKKE